MPKKDKSRKNVKVNDLGAKEDPKGGSWPIKYHGPSATTTSTTTTTTTTKTK